MPEPRWMPLPTLLYTQVIKAYWRRHLVDVTHRVVFGDSVAYALPRLSLPPHAMTSVARSVADQAGIQEEWRPSPPATTSTNVSGDSTSGTMKSSRSFSHASGQDRVPQCPRPLICPRGRRTC